MRWILYTLVFIALLILAGFLLPREITVERSVYITKPPESVFGYVNNLRNFNAWSPWYQLDPTTEYEYSGPEEGVGATMSWQSENPSVGTGSQTIVTSQPDSLVRMDLDFAAQGQATSEIRLQPQGSGTNVTWWFSTDLGGSPIARWFGLMVKRMIGQSYEQGLQKLKNLVESEVETPAPDLGDSPIEDDGTDKELPLADPEGMDEMETDPGDMDPGIQGEVLDEEMLEEEAEEPVEEETT